MRSCPFSQGVWVDTAGGLPLWGKHEVVITPVVSPPWSQDWAPGSNHGCPACLSCPSSKGRLPPACSQVRVEAGTRLCSSSCYVPQLQLLEPRDKDSTHIWVVLKHVGFEFLRICALFPAIYRKPNCKDLPAAS